MTKTIFTHAGWTAFAITLLLTSSVQAGLFGQGLIDPEDGKISGKAPFFAYPYVSLRGIPAIRYQGEEVITAKAEYLRGITPRWSLVFLAVSAKHTHRRLQTNWRY